MPKPPPPAFETTVSEQAQDDLARSPELMAGVNAVVLRAARKVRRMLDEGENLAADLHGRRENVTVRIGLIPPDTVRIEQVVAGGPVPESAIVV